MVQICYFERICDEVIAAGMEAKSMRGLTGGLEKEKLDDAAIKTLKRKEFKDIMDETSLVI